jgi:hypothetical protein
MDIKELVKKVVDGGNADEITKTLDAKQQSDFYAELAQEHKRAADSELRIIEARRKENEKLKTDIDTTQATAEVKVRSQMRGEQIEIAFGRAEEKLAQKGIKLSPEEKAKLRQDFTRFDTGKFDSTLIVGDILSAYGAINAERLIDFSSKAMSGEQAAAQFNASSAGGGNSGGGTTPAKEYDPAVVATVRAGQKFGVAITPEQAEKGLRYSNGDWKSLEGKEGKNSRGNFLQIG